MKIIFLVISLAIIINEAARTDENDQKSEFCKLSGHICTGKYERLFMYSKSCESKRCVAPFIKECPGGYCSKHNDDCHLLSPDSLDSIRNCKQSYHFHPKDVCVNEMGCLMINPLNKNNQLVNIRCRCPKSHSFECGLNFCSVNSMVCNALVNHSFKLVAKQTCLNGNKLFGMKSIFFSKVSRF